jgi:hypothetical protein
MILEKRDDQKDVNKKEKRDRKKEKWLEWHFLQSVTIDLIKSKQSIPFNRSVQRGAHQDFLNGTAKFLSKFFQNTKILDFSRHFPHKIVFFLWSWSTNEPSFHYMNHPIKCFFLARQIFFELFVDLPKV